MSKSPSARKKKRPGSGVRWDKIAEIRDSIRRGTYDTPDKWASILDRLILEARNPDNAPRKKN